MAKPTDLKLTALLQLLAATVFMSTMCCAQATTPDKWREDLNYMVQELEVRHAALYLNVSPESFREAKSKLEAEIPNLSGDRIIVEFARLLAMIGDGHTGVFLPWDRLNGFRKFPIELLFAKDGLLVIAAPPEYSKIVGTRVKKIGRAAISQVSDAIKPLLPLDNDFAVRDLVPYYLVLPEVLYALDFIENPDVLNLTVEDAQGREQTLNINAVSRNEKVDWRMISENVSLPLYLRRRDEKYWYEFVKESKTVYLQFNSADIAPGSDETQFISFCDRLVEFIGSHTVEKLIIDLRWNNGGNFERTRHLLNAVIRSNKVNRPGRLFTVIGPRTFSAGVSHAFVLEQYTKTIFVGEPTGGRPGRIGELRRFRLPNSNIEVRYSAVYHVVRDERPAIMPQLQAELSSADYLNGVDPAIKAIATYRPKESLNKALRELVEKNGVDQALQQYKILRAEHYNEYDFGEDEFENLGNGLLESGQLGAAIAFFKLYVDEFPYSADAYNDLGQAYMKAGKNELAIENFKQAFALDKRFTQALDALRKLQKKN